MKSRFGIILLLALVACGNAFAQLPNLAALRPYPKTAFARAGTFALLSSTPIVAPANPDPATQRAVAFLVEAVRKRAGYSLNVIAPAAYSGGGAILIGTPGTFPELAGALAPNLPRGESLPDTSGGYVLDVTATRATIIGTDADGLFNAVSTLAQLIAPGSAAAIPCVHIWDYPDYPVRWVFSQHNLRGPGQLNALRDIEDAMAALKLNGLQQNDFKYAVLDQQPDYYFDSVRALIAYSVARNIGIIPGVAGIGYSDGILVNDPNLAEGFPASAEYVMAGDAGRIIPDPNMTLPNGNFETVDGNGKFTGWSFYDEGGVSVEHSGVHGGATCARCENFTAGNAAGNCRFSRHVDCKPFHYYRISAWLRTENLDADAVQLLAIGQDDNNNSRTLTFTQFPSYTNQAGWKQVEVYFNTLNFNHVNLYAGVWGGRSGKIWWDDFTVTDAGLMDVLRRAGTPLTVRNHATGAVYNEGTDFAPVHDTLMEQLGTPYGRYHQAPALRRIPAGAIHNGDTLTVSFFHPLTTIVGDDGNGSVMVCVSEDTLYKILRRQIAGVDSLYHGMNANASMADRFFMGHDEIRSLGWDSACQRRHLSAAQLLADNLHRCGDIIEQVRPGAGTFVWSDMFDSLHNASANYYLVNGDLTGDWDMIPKTPTIVNWNGGNNRDKSLAFFAGHGFSQIASPYYDSRNTDNIRAWRLSMNGVPRTNGMMYTTWAQDYDFLAPFAYYSWGAGPFVIHEPVDTTSLPAVGAGPGEVCFRMAVLPDPYDPTDTIADITVRIATYGSDLPPVDEIHLVRDSGNVFTGCYDKAAWEGFTYTVQATNRQGLSRITPRYDVRRTGTSSVAADQFASAALALNIEPNPAAGVASLGFTLPGGGGWTLRVVDLLGHTVLTRQGEGHAGRQHIALDVAGLPNGLYRCELRGGNARAVETLRVIR